MPTTKATTDEHSAMRDATIAHDRKKSIAGDTSTSPGMPSLCTDASDTALNSPPNCHANDSTANATPHANMFCVWRFSRKARRSVKCSSGGTNQLAASHDANRRSRCSKTTASSARSCAFSAARMRSVGSRRTAKVRTMTTPVMMPATV